MSNYFNNLYLLTAILVSMIIHLILLIVTDLTLNHQVYLSPPSDIEVIFVTPTPTPTPTNYNVKEKLAIKPKELIKEKKVIVPTIQKKIKNNAASVKTAPAIKKITEIDSNQILSNIKESIPFSISIKIKNFVVKKFLTQLQTMNINFILKHGVKKSNVLAHSIILKLQNQVFLGHFA